MAKLRSIVVLAILAALFALGSFVGCSSSSDQGGEPLGVCDGGSSCTEEGIPLDTSTPDVQFDIDTAVPDTQGAEAPTDAKSEAPAEAATDGASDG